MAAHCIEASIYFSSMCWGMTSLKFFVGLLLAAIFMYSCNLFDEDEMNPTYVHIPSYEVEVKSGEGTAAQDISDTWVYWGSDLLGAYELGTDIPILEDSDRDLLVFPGIRENGIRSLPSIHFMLRPDTFQIERTPFAIDTIVPTFTYFEDVEFRLVEAFEFGNSFSRNVDNNNSTRIERTMEDAFEGNWSGRMRVDTENPLLEAATDLLYLDLPRGRPVYLEFHYKNDHPFSVGFVGERPAQAITKFYKLNLNESEGWNKVVVNFQNEISQSSFTGYRILFGMLLDPEIGLDTATVYLDNIKLLHR